MENELWSVRDMVWKGGCVVLEVELCSGREGAFALPVADLFARSLC